MSETNDNLDASAPAGVTPPPVVPEAADTKKERLWWIDHARGFIMVMLVVTMFLPESFRTLNAVTRFFMEHPESSTTTTTMNFYDVGAPAFIFIMGLLMPLSYYKRSQQDGKGAALKHLLVRYLIIFALGMLVIAIDGEFEFVKMRDGAPVVVAGMAVVRWDVLPSLGLVGLVAIPFLLVNPKVRAGLAAGMLVFYQLMLVYGGWREYAIESVHGGILGTIFGFGAIMVFATCFGDLFFVEQDISKRKQFQVYGIAGVASFVLGLALHFVPEWYANKRQVTLSYILVSMGTIILISFAFIALGKKYNGRILGLDSYGRSPFFVYVVAIVSEFLISDVIDYDIGWAVGLVMIAVITALVVFLDLKDKIVKI